MAKEIRRKIAGFVLTVAVISAGIKIDGLLQCVPPPAIAPPRSPWLDCKLVGDNKTDNSVTLQECLDSSTLWGVEDGMDDFGTVYIPNRIFNASKK